MKRITGRHIVYANETASIALFAVTHPSAVLRGDTGVREREVVSGRKRYENVLVAPVCAGSLPARVSPFQLWGPCSERATAETIRQIVAEANSSYDEGDAYRRDLNREVQVSSAKDYDETGYEHRTTGFTPPYPAHQYSATEAESTDSGIQGVIVRTS